MAVPFRRTSKTAKRKRRTHKKLSVPAITLDEKSGNYVMGHRIDKKKYLEEINYGSSF